MELSSTSVMIEDSPKMAAASVYVPRLRCSCFLSFQEDLIQIPIKITAYALIPRMYEILCVPFKSKVSLSPSSLRLPILTSTVL